jgi:hypothetical protein
MDDYGQLRRNDFRWQAPFQLSLKARASPKKIPGTWGFGLWNDPFGMAILGGTEMLRLPMLPNTAWFFFASQENYLSLRDDLPAQGGLAATFRSPQWHPLVLALGAPLLPLLALRPTARLLRRLARRFVHQDTAALEIDPSRWHDYRITWQAEDVQFQIDGSRVLQTHISPRGPLGLVIWLDNQYVAFTPQGRVRYGMLNNPEPAWLEIKGLSAGGL